MLDRSLIQSPSSLTTTSLPSAPTGFCSSAATSNTKSHFNNNNKQLHSTTQHYDSLGLPSSTTNKKSISSRRHHLQHNNHRQQQQENSNSFIMQQLKHLKQHQQQPSSTTPPNSGLVNAELIDAKFDQLAKRVLTQLNQKPVEFFHNLDNILTEPLDQRDIEIKEARVATEAAAAAAAAARTRRRNRKNSRGNVSNNNNNISNNDNRYYEKTSGNIVNVTGNTPPSAKSRAKANQIKNHLNSDHHYHSIEKISSSPSHLNINNNHVILENLGQNSAQAKRILDQVDSSFEIEQLVYSDDDFDDDDDDDDQDYYRSLGNDKENYAIDDDTNGNTRAKVNLENVLLGNNNNGPSEANVKRTVNGNNNLAHLNPIMRSTSLGTKNDSLVKVKSPTKQNVITSPNRQQPQPHFSLQKSKTSHGTLSVRTTTGNIDSKSNSSVQSAPRRSPANRNSHHDLLLISSSQKHQKHNQPVIIHNKSKTHLAEPSSTQHQQSSQYQSPNAMYKPHTNYSTSLLANERRLSDDDEIIIIPTKSPSLISNPSPDPDFASNSGFENDSDAAAAATAAANERFSISRTKSFWEKLSNNKTARGVNRRASTTKSSSASLSCSNNNNNSITGNLNNSSNFLCRVNSGNSTSENNNNNTDHKHRSLINHNDLNKTINENIAAVDNQPCYDRYHY